MGPTPWRRWASRRRSIWFRCTVFVSFCYYLGAGGIVSAFMKNESIIGYGTRFLRGFCLEQPLIFVDFLAVGVFQALGMGGYALYFAIMRKILLEIPALYVLNWLFPLYGLAYAQPFAELILAAAALVMLRRIFRKGEEISARPAGKQRKKHFPSKQT